MLGLLAGLAAHHGVPSDVVTVAGTGLLGAYTTFSTFTFDTVALAEHGPGAGRRRPTWGQPGARASAPPPSALVARPRPLTGHRRLRTGAD